MKVSINKIKPNQDNPRLIKDYKFQKLVNSIKEFPEMLEKRPIVVDENMIVLGGNMRLKACQEAGLKEVDITIAEGWTDAQKKEFIIKDNVGFGEWDWDLLANNWQSEKLNDWGLEVWVNEDYNVDDFFTEEKEKEEIFKIVLEYTENDYNKVIDAFNKLSGSKENIIYNFLIKE